jgi:hypothetical protein
MEKEEQRFLRKYFWVKICGSKTIHQELVTTLGADAYGLSPIKIWLRKFRNCDLSCENASRTGRLSLALGRNLRHFFNTTFLPVPEYLRRTLQQMGP